MKIFLHILSGLLCAGAAYVMLFHAYPMGLDETLMWVIVGVIGLLGLILGPFVLEAAFVMF